MADYLTEALLEMHYHRALVRLFEEPTASNDGWIPPSVRNHGANAPAAVLIAPARR